MNKVLFYIIIKKKKKKKNYDNHYYYAAYTWLETSVDVLFKKFARHSRCIRAWIIERLVLSMIRAIRECNISDAHACDY